MEELLDVGVLVRTSPGEHKLSPVLAAGSTFMITRNPAGDPADITSAHGSLSTADPPWLPLAAKRRTNWRDDTQQVLLAWDDRDLHVLHRLGFRVLGAAGLDHLTVSQVPLIFDPAATHGNHYPYDFLLVGWSVAELSGKAPSPLAGALAHLTRIKRLYGVDASQRFMAWMPNAADLRLFRDAVRFKDGDVLKRDFDHSLKVSTATPAGALAWLRDQVELDFRAARRRLHRAVEASSVVPLISEVSAALQQFHRAVEREFGGKLDRLSEATADPLTRLGCHSAAELVELYFEAHPLVDAAKRILSLQHPQYSLQLDDDQLAKRLKIVDAITKLARAAGQ